MPGMDGGRRIADEHGVRPQHLQSRCGREQLLETRVDRHSRHVSDLMRGRQDPVTAMLRRGDTDIACMAKARHSLGFRAFDVARGYWCVLPFEA